MQATIDIDLGKFASEWEVVAVRTPKEGDFYWHRDHAVQSVEDWTSEPMIIVRRKWVWPSWLKAWWYAEDADGTQWAFMQMPRHAGDRWLPTAGSSPRLDRFTDIPKIGGDWRQSLRENPNWKASQE